ncbi:MAG: hypothetical protein GXO26_01440 [Crenarchaeota archaeon]|nr:hypothetical protein [Thermoproteota archaeon]
MSVIVPAGADYWAPEDANVIVDNELSQYIKVRGADGRIYLLKQILQIAPDHVKGVDLYGNLVTVPMFQQDLQDLVRKLNVLNDPRLIGQVDKSLKPARIVIIDEGAEK